MYLLPKPKKYEKKQGFYEISWNTVLTIDENMPLDGTVYAGILQSCIQKHAGIACAFLKGTQRTGDIFLTMEPQLYAAQEYNIKITPDGLTVSGGDGAAVLYGVQTVCQMVMQCGGVLACAEVHDAPDILHRGYFLDETRGRVLSLPYLKEIADRLSRYKINEFQLYIEHTYLFRDLTELWRDETPLTAEDILELDAYCRRLHIELVPALASFGHLYKLLSTRSYGDLCERSQPWNTDFSFLDRMAHHTIDTTDKRANRKSELGLMDLELLSVLTKQAMGYPKETLDAMWKVVLLNQFHDILPGSSIHEVYEVTKEEYEKLAGQLAALTAERSREIAGTGDAVTIFNTTGQVRDDIVTLGALEGSALVDADGTLYPIQKTGDGTGSVAYVRNLPSKGYKSFKVSQTAVEEKTPFTLVGEYQLETPFYTIQLDKQGMFTSIYDKENDREVIQEGQRANLLRMYEDKPIYFDNWDIDIYYTEKYWDVDSVEHMEWTEIGAVRAVLEITRKASQSTIQQNIIFYADSRRIEFETYVDWKEHQTLLKVHFPVAVHTDEAAFDVQFGNLTRKTHQNTSWDVARFESCGQKWMDLSEGHYGVSMLNDCKYGHSVKDSNMALTLIKSGTEPNPTTDQEEHVFTYAIYPHAEGWRAAGTVAEAYKLNQPLLVQTQTAEQEAFSYASAAHANVIVETIKDAEDGSGTVLRLYESENAYTKTKLTVNADFKKAYICNLLEETEHEASVAGKEIEVVLKPYEVVTVKVV